MLYAAFFITVSMLVYSLSTWNAERKTLVNRRIRSFIDRENPENADETENKAKSPGLLTRMVRLIWRSISRLFRRSMRRKILDKIDLKLLQAGRPFHLTPVDYRVLQITMLLAVPLIFAAYGILIGLSLGTDLLLVLFGLFIGFVLPPYYLKIKTTGRVKTALKELPDVLDLLTVSLEAGLGFDAALSKLVAKKQGVLALEFQRCLEEIRLGRTRREALTGVKERLPLDEMRTLITSILQAEKLGIGMVQVMRVQSHEVRQQRRQRAEEAAMKAPIKMLFPLVIFIFPSLFVVLLGPVFIQFLNTFHKG